VGVAKWGKGGGPEPWVTTKKLNTHSFDFQHLGMQKQITFKNIKIGYISLK